MAREEEITGHSQVGWQRGTTGSKGRKLICTSTTNVSFGELDGMLNSAPLICAGGTRLAEMTLG